MIDINSIISLALTSAINKAIEPLLERIDTLEKNEEALVRRITALETNPTGTPATITADAFVTHLDQQEWFWHKVAGFVTNNGIDDELVRIKQRVEALETETQGENRYLNRDEVNELIAEAIDDHLGTYDHDEYDNHLGDDDKHFDGDIEDAVRDALNGTSVTLSF